LFISKTQKDWLIIIIIHYKYYLSFYIKFNLSRLITYRYLIFIKNIFYYFACQILFLITIPCYTQKQSTLIICTIYTIRKKITCATKKTVDFERVAERSAYSTLLFSHVHFYTWQNWKYTEKDNTFDSLCLISTSSLPEFKAIAYLNNKTEGAVAVYAVPACHAYSFGSISFPGILCFLDKWIQAIISDIRN